MAKQTPLVVTAALIIVSVMASATSSAAGFKSGKICFYRNHWIFLKDLATGKETKLVVGLSPRLAPTGDSVAYLSITEPEQDGIEALLVAPAGRLQVLSLRTMKSRSFESLRESRVSTAVWSSNGKLAFARLENHKRSIAMLNPVTGNIEKSITADWDAVIGPTEPIYLDSWTPGDRSVLFHTLSALYEADFDTGNIRKLAVEDVFRRSEISSASTFLFSPDRKYLLFDHITGTAEDPERELISLYDVAANTHRPLTPKHLNARGPVLVDDQLLFTRADYSNSRWVSSICKIGLDGRGLATLIKDADYPSYAPK